MEMSSIKHDDGAGAALEGSLNGTDGNRLSGVTGQMRGAAQLLKHLPVEHGCLSLTGNLNKGRKNKNRDMTAVSGCSDTLRFNCRS